MVWKIGIACFFAVFLATSNTALSDEKCKDEIDIEAIDVTTIRQCAESSHGPSQFMLGMLYLEGNHVPVDGDEAVRWIFESLKQEKYNGAGYMGLSGVLEFGLENPDALPTTIDQWEEMLSQGMAGDNNFFARSAISNILDIDEYGEGDVLLAKYGKKYEELLEFCKRQELSFR